VEQPVLDKTAQRRHKRRRALLAILLSSSIATLGAGAMSLAVFTDSDASSGAWTTGTIVLGVSPATTFSATAIMPGDSGNRDVSVANTGTGDLRYAMSVATTNLDGKGLAGQLRLTITAGTCASAGATLYTGVLSAAYLGSNVQGAHAGDRPVAAALAVELLGVSHVAPIHWGTFPILAGTPEALRAAMHARGLGATVHAWRPGDTIS
jgi:hypothetical protein